MIAACVERRYRTHRGFLRACARYGANAANGYRGRILAYIALPLGCDAPWRLVLAKVQP